MDDAMVVPTGASLAELLTNLAAGGVDLSDRRVMPEVSLQKDGTFAIWIVRIEDAIPIYLGYVATNFRTADEVKVQFEEARMAA
jgi:hypothetical protein